MSLSIRIHGIHGVTVKNGPGATRRLPMTPKANRTGIPGDDSYVGRRTLVGDS
jgi:hypothetical protein